MTNQLFFLFLFVSGVYFFLFGARLLFEKGFVEKLQQGRWKRWSRTNDDGYGYFYDRYAMGLASILMGSIFFFLSILALLNL